METSLDSPNTKYRRVLLRQLNHVTAEIMRLQHAYTVLVAEEIDFSSDILEKCRHKEAANEIQLAADQYSTFRQRSKDIIHHLQECEERKNVLEGVLKVLDG